MERNATPKLHFLEQPVLADEVLEAESWRYNISSTAQTMPNIKMYVKFKAIKSINTEHPEIPIGIEN
jgi:hypothetical protein